MRTTPIRQEELYPLGEFVFVNLTNQTKLTDFDSATYNHRNASKHDLGVRVVWTAGEAPRANVVDFQVLQHHDNATKTHGDQYDEEGWRLTKPPSAQSFTTFGTQSRFYPQSTALFSNTVNGPIVFRRANGAAFDMIQIKLAELGTPAKSPVNFVGFPKTGGQVTFDVKLDGIGPQNGLEIFNFPGSFRNLDRVEWKQVSPFHQFDDIIAKVTPPATGACCLEDGSCVDGLTEAQCNARRGIEWHEEQACDEVECPQPGGCNGNEVIAKAKCKIKRGAVKKAIILVKKATPGDEYTATLQSGQVLSKNAKGNGKAKFTFKGGNKPPCSDNAVTISTSGERCAVKDFGCNCN